MTSKNFSALLLTGVLACGLSAPAAAGHPMHPLISPRPQEPVISARPQTPVIAPQPTPAMADSELYYGEIKGIEKHEDGTLAQLWMASERYGEFVMNLSPKTAYIDSSSHAALDPARLAVGQRGYVYHSAMATRSLPPQAAAFAVVANLPMDASAGKYREVEAVADTGDQLTIASENGTLTILADADTQVLRYDGSAATLADLRPNSFVMVWYEGTGTVHADHLLLLPCEEAPITRAQLISALHASQGSPAVDFLLQFEDVDGSHPAAEAIRWAASTGIMTGYTATDFGAEDEVTLEQAVTVLWRLARSPRLMDYPGLTQYADAGEISDYAMPALLWAHQRGLLDKSAQNLEPQKSLTAEEANALIAAYTAL